MSDRPRKPLPLAVLISGGGTTLRNLLQKIEHGELHAEPRIVISSSPHAGGLQIAQQAGLSAMVIQRAEFATTEAFSEAVFDLCRRQRVGLVVMGGFLKHLHIAHDFENRVVNVHPSLIPAFCGKGYYGLRVHQAVLEYGAKVSGCTVHFVDNEYDHGPIICQNVVTVEQDDTAESLAARVFAEECVAYPQAIQWIADSRLKVEGRHVRLLPSNR